ncbi:MAG: flagellar motor protein MotB [Elusimicrobia bacterium]|nr:flagellar motor protein MotB [Elusimicrobiota bacterium]
MILKPPRGYVAENDPRVSQVGHAAPPWLVNYADLMTELACFFLMIYALGSALFPQIQNSVNEVKKTMEESGIPGEAKVTKDGIQISLQEQQKIPFFVSGSAELLPGMKIFIDKITPALKSGLEIENNFLIVEGHTDNVPIATLQYASNWELSTARATNVVKYLISIHGISPNKVAAIGYGEHRPLFPNDTEINKAKNRRVVFLIKSLGGTE